VGTGNVKGRPLAVAESGSLDLKPARDLEGEAIQIDSGDKALEITVSIGLGAHAPGLDFDKLVERADAAMYAGVDGHDVGANAGHDPTADRRPSSIDSRKPRPRSSSLRWVNAW
jgi:hypothetical protein